MKSSFIATVVVFGFSLQVLAGDIVVRDVNERRAYVKNAITWMAPAWISQDFKFDPSLDVLKGAPDERNDHLLRADTVYCQTAEEDQDHTQGKNTKFWCQLMDPQNGFSLVTKKSGKRDKIKVKYHSPKRYNQEIYGEILSSRLQWALGFGADRMYFVNKAYCHGCTEDPWNSRGVDQSTLKNPRLFSPVAIERKMDGDEIIFQSSLPVSKAGSEIDDTEWRPTPTGEVGGWSFKESMLTLPDDPTRRYNEYMHRDALRLLVVFMFHIDMKPDNNRLVCMGKEDANGKCDGQVLLMVHDAGSSFGTRVKGFSLDKVDFKTFATVPLWKNAPKCQANFDSFVMRDKSMKNPVISEIGRKFLANLLKGFIEGEAGRKRVEDLFRAANIETQKDGTSVKAWSDAFIARAEQVIYPMGKSNPNFACPQ